MFIICINTDVLGGGVAFGADGGDKIWVARLIIRTRLRQLTG